MSEEPKFFVVKSHATGEKYAIEHGDFINKVPKEDRPFIIYRAELWGGAEKLSLRELIARYKRGDRMRPKPQPPAPEAPKTINSVKRRRTHVQATRTDEG